MKDRHFVHPATEIATGTRIAAGFQQQHLETSLREMRRERASARAGTDDYVIKLFCTHGGSLCALEGFQKLDQVAFVLFGQTRVVAELSGAEIVPAIEHVIRTLAQRNQAIDERKEHTPRIFIA